MPFTHRPEESTEDRNARMANTTDAFILWASEFNLIEPVVDEEGEIGFVPAACTHLLDDEDQYDQYEAMLAAEEAMEGPQESPSPAFYAPRHVARRTSRRLPLAAVPVAATVVLASTAAYAAHNISKQTSKVTLPAAAGPVVAAKASTPKVKRNLIAHPAPQVFSASDVLLQHAATQARQALPTVVFTSTVEKGENRPVVKVYRAKHVDLPEKASERAKAVVNSVPGKVKSAPKKVAPVIQQTVEHVVKNVPPVTLPATPAIPVPNTPVVVPPVVVPPVTDIVTDVVTDVVEPTVTVLP